MQRHQLAEIAQVASGQVLGLASGSVRGGRREEDGNDVVAPRDPGHLNQVVAEIFERNPLGKLHTVAVAKGHARLEYELEQSGASQCRQGRGTHRADLRVLDTETDPVIVPPEVEGDHARIESNDIPPQLGEALMARPSAHAQGHAADLAIRIRDLEPFEEHPRVGAELRARVPQEHDSRQSSSSFAKQMML